MLFVLPGYRQFPFRVSPLAIAVGVVGVVLWIALCQWRLEHKLLAPLGLGWLVDPGDRPAFNPLEAFGRHAPLGLHIPGHPLRRPRARRAGDGRILPPRLPDALRPAGQMVGSPLRHRDPRGRHSRHRRPDAHPPRSELLAVVVWFSLVTWLMTRTRNIWDCVAAHAVTNFLLGVYVVTQHQWQLW